MADGITIKPLKVDRLFRRLKAIAPEVEQEMDKAFKKSAEEHAALSAQLAPGSGEYKDTFNAKRVAGAIGAVASTSGSRRAASTVTGPAWGVFAGWIWHFLEFGTTKMSARPHTIPAFRLLRKRMFNRHNRAMGKGIRAALSKK